MPELPEVEVVTRELDRCLRGQVISRVVVRVAKLVSPAAASLRRQLMGEKIRRGWRRAKMVVIELSTGQSVVIHLKMTGQLIYRQANGKLGAAGGHPIPGGEQGQPNRFTHVEIHFAGGGVLFFNDQRKFGWLKLLSAAQLAKLSGHHGIEPLTKQLTPAAGVALAERDPRRPIKQFLLDQKLIVGLGNIYADEACFAARIRPHRPIQSLAGGTLVKLARIIPRLLARAIRHGGTTARDFRHANGQRGNFSRYLMVYGRGGQPCRRCGTIITKTKPQGRGTHYCSQCQQ